MKRKIPKFLICTIEIYDWKNDGGEVQTAYEQTPIFTTDDEAEAQAEFEKRGDILIQNPTKKDLKKRAWISE